MVHIVCIHQYCLVHGPVHYKIKYLPGVTILQQALI